MLVKTLSNENHHSLLGTDEIDATLRRAIRQYLKRSKICLSCSQLLHSRRTGRNSSTCASRRAAMLIGMFTLLTTVQSFPFSIFILKPATLLNCHIRCNDRCISKHSAIHLNDVQFLFVSYTSTKPKK